MKKVGEVITLQKCKHKWLNGVPAVIVQVHGPNDYTAASDSGTVNLHRIGDRQCGVPKPGGHLPEIAKYIRFGAVIVFKKDVTDEDRKRLMLQIAEFVDMDYFVGDDPTELVQTFDSREGGPVWYLP